jgi:hypothetical protein
MTGTNPLAHAPALRIHFDDSTPDHGPLPRRVLPIEYAASESMVSPLRLAMA